MRNVTECQQRLIALGYLPALNEKGERNDDGKFGQRSLDAYNHWRASKGAPPVNAASMAQLNQDLFPEEQLGARPQLTPNPVVQTIGSIALQFALSQLLKGLPVNNIFNVLSGAKTYITGVIMILVGAADYAGWNIPGTASWPAAGWIAAGVLAIAGRNALATSLVAVLEKLGGVDPANLPK